MKRMPGFPITRLLAAVFVTALSVASVNRAVAKPLVALVALQSAVPPAAKTPPVTTQTNTTPIATVQIESTIQGNPEQPKTIYVLPWQESVARIKMSGEDLTPEPDVSEPLDRDDFLRFIEAQDAMNTTNPAGGEQAPLTPTKQ